MKQLKDFWEDIVNLPPNKFHYTGLLSLKQVNNYESKNWVEERWLLEDRAFKAFHIVDGQQRLTTAIIFINEIVNLIKNLPQNKNKVDYDIYVGTFSLKQIKEDYLFIQKPPQFILNTYKFDYEDDNPSFEYLRYKVLNEPYAFSVTETFYTLNLENAKQFFQSNLSNYFDEYGEYGIEKVALLFKKTTQNLMFNLHELEDAFDVFVAFETMNNRGKKLSNLELLKNRLIYITTLYDESELDNDTQIAIRHDINSTWKEIYYQLGRNKLSPLSDDDFLTAHWIMYFQYTRRKGDDYIKFLLDKKFTPQNIFNKTEIILSNVTEVVETRDCESEDELEEVIPEEKTILKAKLSPKEISDYVKSLKSVAVHWYNSFNPLIVSDLTYDEKLWIDRLNRIGIAYFRPLVVASFVRKDISVEKRIELLKEIERFIFIVFKLGRSFATYRSSEYYKLTKRLYSGDINTEEIGDCLKTGIAEFLSPETGLDIRKFRLDIENKYKNGGGFYYWSGLHYFLYEYENEKVLHSGTQKVDWHLFIKGEKDKISIEHIYPQTPTDEYWINSFISETDEQKKFLTGSLGNLLILSKSKNSSLQNDSFPLKKNPSNKASKGYTDGSHSEIEVSVYQNWNSTTILERGMKLLEFMEQRWDLKFKDDEDKKKVLFLDFIDSVSLST